MDAAAFKMPTFVHKFIVKALPTLYLVLGFEPTTFWHWASSHDTILKVLGKFLRVYLVFGKVLILLWQKCFTIEYCCRWPNTFKNYSHLVTLPAQLRYLFVLQTGYHLSLGHLLNCDPKIRFFAQQITGQKIKNKGQLVIAQLVETVVSNAAILKYLL